MKSLKISLIIIGVVSIILVGTSYLFHIKPELIINIQLIGKNLDEPEVDAQRDISSGNIYCYSVNGFVRYFPGISAQENRSVCNFAKEINFVGTSDGIYSYAHGEAISRAYEYSARYNQYVISNVHLTSGSGSGTVKDAVP